jgi:hypothetical protein
VFGVRHRRDDPWHRLALSALLRVGMALMLRVRSADPNVPYKLRRRDCALAALGAMPTSPRIPSILLTVYFARHGMCVVEQRVPHVRRRAGATTLRIRRLAAFCRGALGELLRFHRSLRPGP